MKTIQIRHVPDEVHRTLKSRAALAGMSLSDYALAELERIASAPSREEILDEILAQEPVKLPVSPAQIIREMRDGR